MIRDRRGKFLTHPQQRQLIVNDLHYDFGVVGGQELDQANSVG